MTSPRRKLLLLLSLLVLAGPLVSSALAQVSVATSSFTDQGVFSVSNTDLLSSPSTLSSVSSEGTLYGVINDDFSGGLPAFNDGVFGPPGSFTFNPEDDPRPFAVGFDVTPNSLTFSLNLTTSPNGYNLTTINTYTGWDSGRDGQYYTVFYSLASAPSTFFELITIDPFDPAGAPIFSRTLVSLTDSGAGYLATNVAAVRFSFLGDDGFAFENSGTAYREIDIFGVAAIPEPASFAIISGALVLAVATLRFRRRRSAFATN